MFYTPLRKYCTVYSIHNTFKRKLVLHKCRRSKSEFSHECGTLKKKKSQHLLQHKADCNKNKANRTHTQSREREKRKHITILAEIIKITIRAFTKLIKHQRNYKCELNKTCTQHFTLSAKQKKKKAHCDKESIS